MSEALFLIAHIAGRGVAIEVSQVDSVVDLGPLVPVPGAAPEVLGLAALRSRVLTVIDTYAALNLPRGDTTPSRAVITRIDDHLYALVVDLLEDVAQFALRPLSPGLVLDGAWAQAAVGMVERDDEPLLAIRLDRLIPHCAVAA